MSGTVPACYGNNIINKVQQVKPISCINGRKSLTGASPTVLPIGLPYPGANCTAYACPPCAKK